MHTIPVAPAAPCQQLRRGQRCFAQADSRHPRSLEHQAHCRRNAHVARAQATQDTDEARQLTLYLSIKPHCTMTSRPISAAYLSLHHCVAPTCVAPPWTGAYGCQRTAEVSMTCCNPAMPCSPQETYDLDAPLDETSRKLIDASGAGRSNMSPGWLTELGRLWGGTSVRAPREFGCSVYPCQYQYQYQHQYQYQCRWRILAAVLSLLSCNDRERNPESRESEKGPLINATREPNPKAVIQDVPVADAKPEQSKELLLPCVPMPLKAVSSRN